MATQTKSTLDSKLKKGDDVIVMTGKDKGKSGKIDRVLTATNKVIIPGINVVKKHISQKEAMRLQREPGIEQKEMPIAVSNVMLKDPKTGKPTKIGYSTDKAGNKIRVAKASGETVDIIKNVAKK